MCGISGLIHFDVNRVVSETQLIKMRDSMSHRGPDGAEIFIDRNVGLAHRRLSIIDLSSNATQPFTSQDGRYTITFNGEIYNYKEFVSEIKAKGIHLVSNSDTEVLLYLYILYGESMLNRLNGMWAFVIYDNVNKTMFASRDRMGVKPFYYTLYDNTFFFASEQKGLFSAGVPLEVNKDKLTEILFYRHVSGESTLFHNIKKLLPGHNINLTNDGKFSISRYWNLGLQSQKYKVEGNVYEWYNHHFNKSVDYRMVSDAPVGVLLSGGLDSSSIVHSLFKNGHKNINTFTIKFEELALNESTLAENLAHRYNYIPHSLQLIGDDLYQNVIRALWSHDEPLIHGNDAHLVAISSYSKDYVKVLLSGEGADELMGGYVRYKPLKYYHLLKKLSQLSGYSLGNNNYRLEKINRYMRASNTLDDAILFNASNMYPSDLNYKYDAHPSYRLEILKEAKQFFNNDPIKQMLYLDQHTYMVSLLERNDRATMASGIECREPFLGYELVEGLASLPSSYFVKGKKGKDILFNSIGKELPDEIRNFKKLGFNVPWEKYMRTNEKFTQTLLSCNKSELLNTGVFETIDKETIINDFLKGSDKQKMLIHQFFMLRMWEENYLAKFS